MTAKAKLLSSLHFCRQVTLIVSREGSLEICNLGLKMKKIEGFTGKAPKQRGGGHILYELLVDEHGEFFVKFKGNEIETERPGTFSAVCFPIRKYADKRNTEENIGHPTGIDEVSGQEVTPSENNNGAFLKAVLRDLLPPRTVG